MSFESSAAVRAFVGAGANLGDAVATLRAAVTALRDSPHITVGVLSAIYRNPPLGPPDQPDYCNAVMELRTALGADELLQQLQAIERRFGRERGAERWGARTLDLDLLLYGDAVIRSDRLTVPHPGLRERAFVLYPLHEIAPELVLPGGEALTDLLGGVSARQLQRVATFDSEMSRE